MLPLAENRVVAIDMRTGARSGSSGPEESERKVEDSANSHDDAVHAHADETASSDSGHEEPLDQRMFDVVVRMAQLYERRAEATLGGQPTFPDKPGNLVGGGPFIVSVGPREIVAYPRAVALLNEVKDRLAGSERPANDLLLAADLERMLDGGAAAKDYLGQLREGGPPENAERRSRLLRAVLYQELAASQGDSTAILNELDKLSHTPEERRPLLAVQGGRRLAARKIRRSDRVREPCAARFARACPVAERSDAFDVRSQLAVVAIQRTHVGVSRIGPRPMFGVNARAADEQQAALKSGDRRALERFSGRPSAARFCRLCPVAVGRSADSSRPGPACGAAVDSKSAEFPSGNA